VRRYRITIDGLTYEVEIDDPHARPVTARVSGETFVVEVDSAVDSHQATAGDRPSSGDSTTGSRRSATSSAGGQRALTAPIPGTIVAVVATVGQIVKRGDELLTIEAMKMFNVIRSPWAGTIAAVHVAEGRRVLHGDLLVTVVLT
jgi:glutaconyl-CoA/methylmalonyl-CoA decarboxylase subunit gamma